MCFSIKINFNPNDFCKKFNCETNLNTDNQIISTAFGPTKNDLVPVLAFKDNNLLVEEMNWSLTPSWSKDYPVKWGTYNARMDRDKNGQLQKVFDTPTFKNAFRQKQFCIVPINAAIESCYWGADGGNILSFSRIDGEDIYAAGLWDQWINKSSGEIHYSFTLLTDGPYKYLFDHGHDRSIIGLNEEVIEDFLTNNSRNHIQNFDFIRENRTKYSWSHQIERPLKDGWQKRAPKTSEIEQIKATVWS